VSSFLTAPQHNIGYILPYSENHEDKLQLEVRLSERKEISYSTEVNNHAYPWRNGQADLTPDPAGEAHDTPRLPNCLTGRGYRGYPLPILYSSRCLLRLDLGACLKFYFL